MIVKSKIMAILVVIIFAGGILVSNVAGWWQTETTKEAAVFTSGEFAGQANPEDIRGSYTFGDVEKNFAIPVSVLASAFNVQTADPASFQVKDLESLNTEEAAEIGTASVRLFAAFYLGLPYDLTLDTYLPEAATSLLQDRNLTTEQITYLATHTISSSPEATAENEIASSPNPTQENEPTGTPDPTSLAPVEPTATAPTPLSENSDTQVKGKTTFAELLDWGVQQATIEQLIGSPLPASTGMTVKDFCTANGLSFEDIRTALQAEVDSLK